MSEAGTLLSELDGARPSDTDLVDSILSDLNQPSGGNPVMQTNAPPPAGARMPMQAAPPPPNMYPNSSDPAVATAHMIGRDHPTPADFQRMMMSAQGPLPYNAMVPQMQQAVAPQQQQMPPQMYESPQKNWQGQWIDELKQPLLVAIVILFVTLPAVNLLVTHYAPQLLSPGGDFTLVGKVARALFGGFIYWILQRVIGPLVSF
jgi:hypothetical protein